MAQTDSTPSAKFLTNTDAHIQKLRQNETFSQPSLFLIIENSLPHSLTHKTHNSRKPPSQKDLDKKPFLEK
jgi:hypothetical protein